MGGIYTYNEGECSCCFGLPKGNFFEVNANKPFNWDDMVHKFSYSLDDEEKATEFRLFLNDIVKNEPGVTLASNNYEAVMLPE